MSSDPNASGSPCFLYEDDHLLVVNKPAGMNTHRPSPYAGEGIYDWLRNREPRWAKLAILHRLDKETSGVLVFGKTAIANRSLTDQFTRRLVRKKYVLLTDKAVRQKDWTVRSQLARVGDRYISGIRGELAETRFRIVGPCAQRANLTCLEAEPITGRTHQIRAHAAESGLPILGDTLYGGSDFARVCLHAAEIVLRHPTEGTERVFRADADFESDPRLQLRKNLIDAEKTNAFRLLHGASDGWPGLYVDKLGEFLLAQSAHALGERERRRVEQLAVSASVTGVYHKTLDAQVRRSSTASASPGFLFGKAAPERFEIHENGLAFELSFTEGYSVGLFLDQRDNRRRLLTGHIGAEFPLFAAAPGTAGKPRILNTFAYTCGFSVAAAKGGAHLTSLDLSRKYLEWGRRNFQLNGLEPDDHDFVYGDVFGWLRRWSKKQRNFDVILLDPPTFSQSKEQGVFRVEKDYDRLVTAALPLLSAGGVLFASTNAGGFEHEDFLSALEAAIAKAGRRVVQRCYVPQPPDFPVTREEPAYLKTVWLRLNPE